MAIAIVSLSVTKVWAWGCEGHEVVALIAQKHLNRNAALQAENLLRVNTEFDTLRHRCVPASNLPQFAVVSTWADDYRDKHKATNGWHFRNIPLDAAGSLTPDSYCEGDIGCVTKAVSSEISVLKNACSTREEQSQALIFLIHFVGDLHQPLHCEDNADRGGNCVPVTYNSERPSLKGGSYIPNLHGIWDQQLVESSAATRDPSRFADVLDSEFSQDISRLLTQSTNLDDWSWEAHRYALDVAYANLPVKIETVQSGTNVQECSQQNRYLELTEVIDDKYSATARPIIRAQLARGGARLAHILNDIWSDSSSAAATDLGTTLAQSHLSGSHRKAIVYVASPLGFAESTRCFMNKTLLPLIEATGVEVENPWDNTPQMNEQLREEKKIMDLKRRRAAWTGVVQSFGGSNAGEIAKADGIVAVLDGVDVDSGTAAEVGYATGLGKWVIGYRGDFRRTGEDETSEVNLQVEYFIAKNGGVVVHTLDDLKSAIEQRVKNLK